MTTTDSRDQLSETSQRLLDLCHTVGRELPVTVDDHLLAVEHPDWEAANGPWDWRHYVSPEVAVVWESLSIESRLALHYDAVVRGSRWHH